MSQQSAPSWYVPDDLWATVENARAAGDSVSAVANFLAETELEGVPKERVERIVSAVPETTSSTDGGVDLSQTPSTSAEPRTQLSRRFSVADVEYLADDEFARVLRLAFEAFGDETVQPPADDPFDLYWDRDDETLGVKTVTATGDDLCTDVVEAAAADESPRVDVSFDRAIVVTNGRFTNDATEAAADAGIVLLDRGQLETILERAMLSTTAVGTVLEAGETHDGTLQKLTAIEAVPDVRCTIDGEATRTAAEIDRITDPEALGGEDDRNDDSETTGEDDTEPTPEAGDDDSLVEPGDTETTDDSVEQGERGVLYANPDEDGDYDAFDDFVEEL